MAFAELTPLAQFIVCGVFLAFVYAWMETGGKLVQWLAAHFPNPSIGVRFLGHIKPFDPIVQALTGFDNYVQRLFYFYLDATKAGWNAWVHTVASFVSTITEDYYGLATETGKALHWLRRYTIPALIQAHIGWIPRQLARIEKRIAALATAVATAAVATTHVVIHEIPKVTQDITRITKRVYVAVPAAVTAAVAVPWGAIHGLERDTTRLGKWVKEHEKLLTIAGAGGLVVAALSRVGLGWIKCSNVGRTAKAVCGMDRNLLESILGDATLILGTVSLVEFAQGMEEIAAEIAPAVKKFWRA